MSPTCWWLLLLKWLLCCFSCFADTVCLNVRDLLLFQKRRERRTKSPAPFFAPAVTPPHLVVAHCEFLRACDTICQLSDRQCCVHIVFLLGKMSMLLLKLVVCCWSHTEWFRNPIRAGTNGSWTHQSCISLTAPPTSGSSFFSDFRLQTSQRSFSVLFSLAGGSIQTDRQSDSIQKTMKHSIQSKILYFPPSGSSVSSRSVKRGTT